MPELPEIKNRARELKSVLVGKTLSGVRVIQPKSLNLPQEEFREAVTGARCSDIFNHGKWIFVETDKGWILINLGMGGEILWTKRDALPEKYRIVFDIEKDYSLCINFWWFGYVHHVLLDELHEHKMTAKLGPNADQITQDEFSQLLMGRRGRIKSFLLNQKNIAGIGNAYIHDILFMAGLHPNRAINTLNDGETIKLYEAVRAGLQPSIDKRGAFYELDIYGKKGGFTMEDIQIGYKEESPCPRCGTAIEKIKTGSTSSFICSRCQV